MLYHRRPFWDRKLHAARLTRARHGCFHSSRLRTEATSRTKADGIALRPRRSLVCRDRRPRTERRGKPLLKLPTAGHQARGNLPLDAIFGHPTALCAGFERNAQSPPVMRLQDCPDDGQECQAQGRYHAGSSGPFVPLSQLVKTRTLRCADCGNGALGVITERKRHVPSFTGLAQMPRGASRHAILDAASAQLSQHRTSSVVVGVPSNPSHGKPVGLGFITYCGQRAVQQLLDALDASRKRQHKEHALLANGGQEPLCRGAVGLHHLFEAAQLPEGPNLARLGFGKGDVCSAGKHEQTIPVALVVRKQEARKRFLFSRARRFDFLQCRSVPSRSIGATGPSEGGAEARPWSWMQ
jgi:hypothetical protein